MNYQTRQIILPKKNPEIDVYLTDNPFVSKQHEAVGEKISL